MSIEITVSLPIPGLDLYAEVAGMQWLPAKTMVTLNLWRDREARDAGVKPIQFNVDYKNIPALIKQVND